MTANASSGLTVSFTSQTSGICTVTGATVHLVAFGKCTIRATQAGDNFYAAAAPVTQSFQVTGNGCDVNLDGSVNLSDVQRISSEALGVLAVVDDLNSDANVTVVDIQITVNAVLGLGCALQ